MPGVIEALGTAERGGAPIESQRSLRVVVARGVIDDRYGDGTGTWRGHPDQDVTLVEAEEAVALGIEPLELRRNVVTRGVDLAALIGRTFRAGDAVLHGMRVCAPCAYLEGKLQRPGLKDALRGGLRARVVRPGTLRVGDAVEPIETQLDADMRAVVEAAHLAFVATVTADGRPNLSPKGTIRVLDDRRLFFLDLASPQTRRNLEKNVWMEMNVVDTTSRRGYRFLGRAAVHKDDEVHRAARERIAREDDASYADRGAVVLTVERALPLLSPGYQHVHDEWAMREAWKPKRVALDAAFEAHVREHGPQPGTR